VDRRPNIGLVFIDVGAKAYLSITGTARVTDDPELRAAAWRKNDVVWWARGGRTTRMFVSWFCELATAELWDGPSSAAVAAYEFAKGPVHGHRAEPRRKPQNHG